VTLATTAHDSDRAERGHENPTRDRADLLKHDLEIRESAPHLI
jgi:hypothetical protein